MRLLIASVFLAAFALAGCHSSSPPQAQSAAAGNVKIYHLRGKIVATNPVTGEITVDSEAIPGYMEAMVMPYKLKNPGIIGDLHPGDTITADILVSQGADGSVLLDHIDVIAQGKPDYKPAAVYHVPAPGDAVPDFTLRNQDGRTIHLDQFHGKALLITFIYTRCPLPNFCPLVTHNFAVIDNQLKADSALYKHTHLLCVSFDPVHDTPARLRAYGAEYVGSDAPQAFKHLEFGVPSESELKKMALYFDVGFSQGPNDTITHTMSTTLIGPDGKVAQFYPGNEWTPDQVLSDVKHIEASAG